VQRIDLLQFIHKALRHAILTTNLESGRVDYADADATRRIHDAWTRLRENIAHHADHEDEFIFPLLDARSPGEAAGLKRDHEMIQTLEADMSDLVERLSTETDANVRRLLGSEFHRAMQHYTTVCLSHFDDEERHLMPRLWALYDDDALEAAYGQIMATIGPAEQEYAITHMRQALDPVELQALEQRIAS